MNDTASPLFDDSELHALVRRLLPSVNECLVRRHHGTILVRFTAPDDFIATTIATSSANIVCEVDNTFADKHVQPRRIASCTLQMRLTPDLNDERLIWFFAELALLRRREGALQESEFALLYADLHAKRPEASK